MVNEILMFGGWVGEVLVMTSFFRTAWFAALPKPLTPPSNRFTAEGEGVYVA